MKAHLLVAAALLAGSFSGLEARDVKGNGNIVTKTVSVSDYQEIRFYGLPCNGSFSFSDLFSGRKRFISPVFQYSQKKATSLKITTDENIYPLLKVTVQDGELRVYADQDDCLMPTKLLVEGSSPSLQRVSIGTGADFILMNDFEGQSLEVSIGGGGDFSAEQKLSVGQGDFSVSGGGDLDIENLQCKNLEVRVSGGGDANLAGTAETAEYRVSGGGDLDSKELTADHVIARVSGGGDISVYANKTLEARASGGGDIYYRGNAEVNSSTSGGGSVRKIK